MPGLERARQRQFGERQQAGFVGAGHEAVGREDAVLRMAHARERFRAGELLLSQVDLRLIPEFDPAVLEGFVEAETRGDRRGMAKLLVWRIFWMVEVSNGFLSTGSMRSLCCSPISLMFSSTAEPRLLISCTAPREAGLAERLERLDRLLGLQADVEEDEIRRARGARLRGTPCRRQIPSCRRRSLAGSATRNAGCCFFVDDEAERRAARCAGSSAARPLAGARLGSDIVGAMPRARGVPAIPTELSQSG